MKSIGRRSIAFGIALHLSVFGCGLANATSYYWDANGTSAGAGDTPSGTWGSSAFWNPTSTGGSGTFITSTGSGDDLSFVAGAAATSGDGNFAVTVSGTQNAHSLTFQSSGAATLFGSGTIDLWGGGISVPQIAYSTVNQGVVTISAPMALQANQTWTNNGVSTFSVSGNVADGGDALTIGGTGNTTYSGVMSGTGTLTKAGLGTLTMTGANTFNGGITVAAGDLMVASTGVLTMTTGKTLYVGNSGPAAMTIQDSGSVTASEFDVNFAATSATTGSTLTLTGGTLSVSGPTYIGRASTRGDASMTSAAVYQSGGTATFSGAATVGYKGTTTSLYDIDGGTLTASAGLWVGGNSGNGVSGQGNGVLNIHGSGAVNVSGGSGLIIGQDANRTTAGSVNLSSGSLSVAGNVTLGGNAGSGSLSRSGGSFSATGNLVIAGNATLTLDATTGSVATNFTTSGGTLSHTGSTSTLVIVPVTGALDTSEAVSFATDPLPSGASIIGAWTVRQASATDTTGDYLTTTGSGPYRLTTATYGSTNFSGATSSSIVNVSGTPTVSSSLTVTAMKVSGTATIGSGQTLTLSSGGAIVNGGTVTGGTLAFGATPLVYAGSASSGTIASQIQSSAGLVKFGPGTLILSADNSGTLSNALLVNTGTLNARNSGALGGGGSGSPVNVAAGAALELQNNIAVGNVPITLNGNGPSGSGSLRNVQDNNSLGAAITLGSNSQINTVAGTLTLSGAVQGSYTLTKTGGGTLVLAGSSGSAFPASVIVSSGAIRVQNANGLGTGGGLVTATVTSGSGLQLQGGIAVPNVSLTLSGTGSSGNGALESVAGNNSFAGGVSLNSDSQVNIDSASDTLTLSGVISGGFALTKGGAGTLVLSGTNTFTQAINVLSGTLSVASVNNSGSSGSLGAGTAPIILGRSGNTATLLYTGSSAATTTRAFTLAGGGGQFPVTANFTVNGVIDGNGGLLNSGTGTLTLGGVDIYTGATTVTGGTLAVSSTGSINGSTAIIVSQSGALQVTAGTSAAGQLPDSGNVTLAGGSLSYIDNGTTTPGELAGALVLNPGQNNVTASNSGSGTPYLRFASAPLLHTTGATVTFTSTSSAIQFQTNPLALSNGIIGGYAFTSDSGGTTVDFATLTSTAPYAIQAYASGSYTTGDLGTLPAMSSGPDNVAPSGSQSTVSSKTINSLKLTGSTGVTITTSNTLSLGSGGLIANTTGTISGGTLAAPNGELVVNAVQHLAVSSDITASTALVKTGSATLTLTSTTPITGATYLNQGTLEYAPTGNFTYAGAISGVGNLLKSGSATLTLSGTTSYTGSTTVTGGALRVTGTLGAGTSVSLQAAALTGSGTVAGNVNVTSSGGAIAMDSGATIGGQVSDSSSVLTVGQTGGSNYLNTTGGLNVSGTGTLVANSSSAVINGNVNYSSSANSTYAGAVAGTSVVTLNSSSGTALTLSGSNTFSGGSVIQSGTLRTANSTGLGTGGLTLTGGILDLNSYSETVTGLNGTGGTITNDQTSTTSTLTVNSGNYSGTFAGGGTGEGLLALVKSGSGMLTILQPGNNLSSVTVGDGTLIVRGGLISNSLVIGSGAVFELGPSDASGNPLAALSFADNASSFASPSAAAPLSLDTSTIGSSGSVPEPSTLALAVIAAGVFAFSRLRTRIGR